MIAFQPDAFQNDAFQAAEPGSGVIAQTVPSFTQSASGIVGIPEMADVLGQMFRFRPPQIPFNINASIRQTIPSFTQSLDVRVTDDELVLMLI